MTEPLPPWRVVSERDGMVTLEVDLPDLSRSNVVIFAQQMGTPAMDGMLRLALKNWADAKAAANTPGDVITHDVRTGNILGSSPRIPT